VILLQGKFEISSKVVFEFLLEVRTIQIDIPISKLGWNCAEKFFSNLRTNVFPKHTKLCGEKRLVEIMNSEFLIPCNRHHSLVIAQHQRVPIPCHVIEVEGVCINETVR